MSASKSNSLATFAMGCFWAPDALFGVQRGVIRVQVGYTGGKKPNPTYANLFDHTEATRIEFDSNLISYQNLLRLFWRNHDASEQHKTQYQSAIYWADENQKAEALQSMEEQQKQLKARIVTLIEPSTEFYTAENYHQKWTLRKHEWLLRSLAWNDSDILDSPLAAKLNGFLANKSNLNDFEQMLPQLSLTSEQADYVRRHIK